MELVEYFYLLTLSSASTAPGNPNQNGLGLALGDIVDVAFRGL